MKLVHGIDLVEVDRLAQMLRESRTVQTFLDMGWTADEQAYCLGSPERLASRWAAKEATMKALGQGIGPLRLTEIEVTSETLAPSLLLSGAAAQRACDLGIDTWLISMSHERGMSVASVIGTFGDERA